MWYIIYVFNKLNKNIYNEVTKLNIYVVGWPQEKIAWLTKPYY